MADDEDLKSVKDVMAEWGDTLPPNHPGRVLLEALSDMEAGGLEHRTLEGPEEPESTIWESILTVGTTRDGAARYFLYPAAQSDEDLKARDVLLGMIASRPEQTAKAEDLLAEADGPNLTLAMAYYGHDKHGTRLLGFAWHPEVPFEKAVGYLKLSVVHIREKEAEASGGSS